jgi:hypothetical protein
LTLENDVIAMTWRGSGGVLRPQSIEDKIAKKTLPVEKSECFELVLTNTPLPGTQTWRASDLHMTGKPEVGAIEADTHAVRLADRQPGRTLSHSDVCR